jgi:uncharacterized protein
MSDDMTFPHGTVSHVAINADDPVATRHFYEQVFSWRFEPWGPPGFFHIKRADGSLPGPIGALQGRRELVPGQRTVGFECTVAVDDVDAVLAATAAAGGTVLMDKTTIAGVGDLAFVQDPSGNVVGAMRYDAAAT